MTTKYGGNFDNINGKNQTTISKCYKKIHIDHKKSLHNLDTEIRDNYCK